MARNKISFNQLFKLKFADGENISVVILDPKSKENIRDIPNSAKSRYWCSADSPLGKALFGHEQGETVTESPR